MPRYRETPKQRGRLALELLVGLVAALGVAGAALIATSGSDPEGAGLSIFYAILPLPVVWFCYWWLDRYEPEPRRYKIAAFVWGGVVAVAIALALQIFIQETWDLSEDTMASVIAPVTEEPAKCLFLLLTFVRWRRVIDGFLDGLVLAGIVGIGFAFIENIGYYLDSYLGSPDTKLAGAEGATLTFIVRGIFSPFAHPLFTSAFGIALGIAVMCRSRVLKVIVVVLGLTASIGLHAVWNSSLSYGGGRGFIQAYLALAAVLFLLGVFAIVVRVRQVRVLESSLAYVSERGWIHPAEIPYLSRFRYRRRARRYAKKNHGKVALKAIRRYQALATQMSFLHAAMMSGRTMPHGVERTYALLDAMHELRPYLRLPPALGSRRG
ncbi:hypothetical protein ASD11_03245 [Aeromicrobium sp. Root495]|nr:hypothetical protein ASD11_03245 [Aeromicrobium sp. Root495]